MRTWIPITQFQETLKSRFDTKAAIMEILEISRPTLDRIMREEHRFLPYLEILSRIMKVDSSKLFNIIENKT
jgi:hypothetical protein